MTNRVDENGWNNREKFLEKAIARSKMRKAQFELEYEYFKEHCDHLDDDGYPTIDALCLIESWHYDNPVGWFEFIKLLWYASNWGWSSSVNPHRWKENEFVTTHEISTAGWSGNESIIRAMQKNEMLWGMTHYQSRRGGHYIFEVEKNQVKSVLKEHFGVEE